MKDTNTGRQSESNSSIQSGRRHRIAVNSSKKTKNNVGWML